MRRPVETVTILDVAPTDELISVKSTAGFRPNDVVQLVTRLEDRRETALVVSVIRHVALVLDRWEAHPGQFAKGAAVERVGAVK